MNKKLQILIVVVSVLALLAGLIVYFNPFSSTTELVDTNAKGQVTKGFIPEDSEVKVGPYILPADHNIRMKNATSGDYQQVLLYHKRENNPSGYITYGPTDSINLANLAQSQTGSPSNYSGDYQPTMVLDKLAGKEAVLVTIPSVTSNEVRLILMQLHGKNAFQLAMTGSAEQEAAIKSRLRAYAGKITREK